MQRVMKCAKSGIVVNDLSAYPAVVDPNTISCDTSVHISTVHVPCFNGNVYAPRVGLVRWYGGKLHPFPHDHRGCGVFWFIQMHHDRRFVFMNRGNTYLLTRRLINAV